MWGSLELEDVHEDYTPETNMETQKGPYKDYSPLKRGAIWVSMLVWGSVHSTHFGGAFAQQRRGVPSSRHCSTLLAFLQPYEL